MTLPTPPDLRTRFHALGKQREEIIAKAAPLQAQFDALRVKQDEIAGQLTPISDQLRAIKSPLYDIDVERAAIARALNGKTGEPS